MFEKQTKDQKTKIVLSWIMKDKNIVTDKFLELEDLNLSHSYVQKLANSIISTKWIRGFCSVEAYDQIETLVANFFLKKTNGCAKSVQML